MLIKSSKIVNLFSKAGSMGMFVPTRGFLFTRNTRHKGFNNAQNYNKLYPFLMGYSPKRAFRTSSILYKDFYDELSCHKSASQDDLKKAYFKLAKKYHPDVNKTSEAKERFSKINNAYETLSDDGKRRVYD